MEGTVSFSLCERNEPRGSSLVLRCAHGVDIVNCTRRTRIGFRWFQFCTYFNVVIQKEESGNCMQWKFPSFPMPFQAPRVTCTLQSFLTIE
jgi:hypothetical protein